MKFIAFLSMITLLSLADKKEKQPNDGVLNTKAIAHIAMVVNDIEQTAETYSQVFDIPKPKIKFGQSPLYKGKETSGKAKMCFLKFENITIEMFEPVGGPSAWQEFLDEKGEGVHHLGIWIEGMDEKVEWFTEQGMPVIQSGGGDWGKYNYIDASTGLGVMIELLEKAKVEE